MAVMGDEAGNLGRATNTISFSMVTNALYEYDGAGNVTNIDYNAGETTLAPAWNARYQLSSVDTDGVAAESYTYDSLGRRLSTITATTTNLHVYDGIHCVADVDDQGGLVRSYVYGPGIDNPLAMTVHGVSTTNTYYYLTDHLGSVIAITDTNGAIVESYDYDAWGRVQAYDSENLPLEQSALGNRIAFQGREYSWATGLYYFRARWYDPVTGRWLSKDPIGISGGLNQYVAFENNPVMALDPDGLQATMIWGAERNPFTGVPLEPMRPGEGLGGNFIREMNPFAQGTSANDQFAAGWALAMGDPETAGQLSGIGQIQDSGASKGWEYAYWAAIAVSFTADACALAIGSYEAIALGNQSINQRNQTRGRARF